MIFFYSGVAVLRKKLLKEILDSLWTCRKELLQYTLAPYTSNSLSAVI